MKSAYPDPAALRRALTDRLRNLAASRPGIQLTDLQRQFAYDRLLTRVFIADPDGWVLKGAAAILARLQAPGRHTKDVDLYRRSGSIDRAEADLRAAAALDLNDHFRFTLAPGRPFSQGGIGVRRIPVDARLGVSTFASFRVDLVTAIYMTAEPDDVQPLVPVELVGVRTINYKAYPLVDHISDKLFALVEVHPRNEGPPEPSSRYRDLVDLVVFAHTAVIDADALMNAFRSEAARRLITPPPRVTAPQTPGWIAGYRRIARDVPGLMEQDIDAAIATVGSWLDPLLAGRALGRWDPKAQSWKG